MHVGIGANLVALAHPNPKGIFFAAEDDDGGSLREWSSLIGIITAIVGNILISFALNIQRYAHIRLNRERIQRTKSWNTIKGKKGTGSNYGTQQEEIVEQRAELNLSAPAQDEDSPSHRRRYHDRFDTTNGEATPLKGSTHSRSSSEFTARQSEKNEPSAQNTTYLKSGYWWAGILLMTTGEAGNFLAYGFAPASIVSPLGVVALVSNCIIAPCLLKERFRQRDFWGVLIAVGGAVTVVLSAKNSETKMGPHDVWVAITRWEFELYLGLTAGMMVLLVWASGRYGQRTILIDLGLVGLFGGYTALSTKGIASLLSDTLWRALTFPITYLLAFILVSTALLQIRYVNRALQRFDSTQVIPTQFVMFTLSVIIGSAVLYRDFESATADRVGKFIGGCLLTFLGVYFITSGRPRGDDFEEDVEAEDEETMIGLVDEESYQDELEEVHDGEDQSTGRFFASSMRHASLSLSRQVSRQESLSYVAPETPQLNSNQSSTPGTPFPVMINGPVSPLLENPWRSTPDNIGEFGLRHPLQSTISSPVLPTEAQELRPSTARAQTQQLQNSARVDRPSTLSRNSISRMMPGPLISPLSSSLSAVVADNLRKGVDSPPKKRRRGLSAIRKSRSQRLSNEPPEVEQPRALSPLKSVQKTSCNEGLETPSATSRSRSMSTSLGDFFGSKFNRSNKRSEDKGAERDEGSEGRE